jgi:hypothetical protein
MARGTRFAWLAGTLLFGPACGGSKPEPKVGQEPSGTTDSTASASSDTDADGGATPVSIDNAADPNKPDTTCTGFEMDFMTALNKSACEVQNAKSEPKDLKAVLDVKVLTDTRVAPGGHADVTVTFTNKSPNLLPLDFVIDPTARFQIEIYNAKTNKRIDMPPGKPPKLPAGMAPREPGAQSTARVTLAANGKGTVKLGWDATRMRWAPEKLKGTPPEQGYPRVAAGPLPKGKYTLRVVTPLTAVMEGVDHEISAPKTIIEVQ